MRIIVKNICTLSVLGQSYEASEVPKLPVHLAEHQRDKLLVDPEVNTPRLTVAITTAMPSRDERRLFVPIFPRQLVIERSHMSGELFNLYLHQNYLDFFSEVDDIARASEYLSDSDFLTAEWTVSCR